MTISGYQEAMILVKGGYTPDVIVVEQSEWRCEEVGELTARGRVSEAAFIRSRR